MKKSPLFFILIILLSCLACSNQPETNLPKADYSLCEKLKTENMTDRPQEFVDLNPLIRPNQTGVYVLEQGEDAIINRAWLGQNATQTIDVQYFIFSYDNIGIISCDYMLKAACSGIKVRVLVDDLMIDVNTDYILALDRHENISIKIYNPNLNIGKNLGEKLFKSITDFRGVNQRMHHKSFIVDQQVAITGGRNIADEYFDYDHEYNFRDRDVLLLGGEVKSIQTAFDEYWASPLSVPLADLINFSKEDIDPQAIYQMMHEYSIDPLNFWPEIKAQIPNTFQRVINSDEFYWIDRVEYVSDIPGKNETTRGLKGGGNTTDALIKLVKNAQKSLYIQTPYLVTSDLSLNLFREATKRGVDIHILTNSLSSTDNLEAFSGYQRNRSKILETGVKIYEYRPDAAIRKELMTSDLQKKLDYQPIFGLHAKSMVVDDSIAIIGTFNLDPRSAHLNTECITIIHSKAVAQNMKAIMQVEQQAENAWTITPNFNPDKEAGTKKRLKTLTRRIVPKDIL